MWIDDHWLVDGAILDAVPGRVTRELGANVVIGVTLSGAPRAAASFANASDAPGSSSSPNLLNVLYHAWSIMISEVSIWSIKDADVTIQVDLAQAGVLDFKRARAYVSTGEAALERALPRIRALLPWLSRAD